MSASSPKAFVQMGSGPMAVATGNGEGPLASNGGSNGPPRGPTVRLTSNGGSNGPPRRRVGLGYHADLPDTRDRELTSAESVREIAKLSLDKSSRPERADGPPKGRPPKGRKGPPAGGGGQHLMGDVDPPERWDLRDGPGADHFSDVEDQGEIGSCTAQAVAGLVEYLMRRGDPSCAFELSRMFLYKTSRRLLGWTGDTGAYLRTTIKALRIFGAPPEREWPYALDLLDSEPEAYTYAYAQSFRAMAYGRLDGYGKDGDQTLRSVQQCLADGYPVVFGFPVYTSIERMQPGEDIVVLPTPGGRDRTIGGHAVLAVGYDEENLIFRNSWGTGWGRAGYGRLPFAYVTKQLAVDFWTVFNDDWLSLEQFE